MQGLSGHKTIIATIATGGSVTTAINVTQWNHVSIEVPTYAVGCVTATANIKCLVAKNNTDTFRPVREMGVYSANSGIQDWEIPSSAGNFNAICRPAARFNWVKFQISNTCTANLGCVVHVHN